MKPLYKKTVAPLLLTLAMATLFCVFSTPVAAQDKQTVLFLVKSDIGEKIADVEIYLISGKKEDIIGVTGSEGNASLSLPKNASVRFKILGYKEKEVRVSGRSRIVVELEQTAEVLEEVFVTAEAPVVTPAASDLTIEGGYLKIWVKFPITSRLFNSRYRIIHQPRLHDVKNKKWYYFSPHVIDGDEYNKTQERMMGFDPENDPLLKYAKIVSLKDTTIAAVKQLKEQERFNEKSKILEKELQRARNSARTAQERDSVTQLLKKHSEWVSKNKPSIRIDYIKRDSIYVGKAEGDYQVLSFTSVEDYIKILQGDSVMTSTGARNPMRFFEYSLTPLRITEEKYIPQPIPQPMSTRGEIKLAFDVNESSALQNPSNRIYIDELASQLKDIERDSNKKLLSFSMTGVSSPDGMYDKNQELAGKRLESAQNAVMQQIVTRGVKTKSEVSVAGWNKVANLLEQDSLLTEAEEVRQVIKNKNTPDEQWRAMLQLPYYKSLISPKYLPQLRTVEYQFNYEEMRNLTDNEIKEKYKTNYRDLFNYEFYRLAILTKNPKEKEEVLRRALELDKKFLYGANELAVLLIEQNKPDMSVLSGLVNRFSPTPVLANQAIMGVLDGDFRAADSISSYLDPDDPMVYDLKAITLALNGRYKLAYDKYKGTDTLNEVVILLSMGRNAEAYEKAQKLPRDNARALYVSAIATTRTRGDSGFNEALSLLMEAFAIDPSLEEIAKIDGDIKDLLE